MNYLYLLINPVKFFKQEKEKEKFSLLIPILLLILIGGLLGCAQGIADLNVADFTAYEDPGLTPDQIASSIRTAKVIVLIMTAIIVVLSTFVVTVVKAGIFNFILKKMGGEGSFQGAFCIASLVQFPHIFRAILNFIFQHPADLTKFDIFSTLGAHINVFNIWQIVLTIIGLGIVYGVSYKKTTLIVLGVEILAAVLNVALRLINLSTLSDLGVTTTEGALTVTGNFKIA